MDFQYPQWLSSFMLCDNESTVAGLEPAMSCRWPRQPASHQKQKHKKNLLWSPIPIQMIWLLKLEKLVRDAQVSDCKQLCCFDWFIWYESSTSSIWVSWHDSFGVTKLCLVLQVTLCAGPVCGPVQFLHLPDQSELSYHVSVDLMLLMHH